MELGLGLAPSLRFHYNLLIAKFLLLFIKNNLKASLCDMGHEFVSLNKSDHKSQNILWQ